MPYYLVNSTNSTGEGWEEKTPPRGSPLVSYTRLIINFSPPEKCAWKTASAFLSIPSFVILLVIFPVCRANRWMVDSQRCSSFDSQWFSRQLQEMDGALQKCCWKVRGGAFAETYNRWKESCQRFTDSNGGTIVTLWQTASNNKQLWFTRGTFAVIFSNHLQTNISGSKLCGDLETDMAAFWRQCGLFAALSQTNN